MKPMIFQVDEAFQQLNEHGVVNSARGSKRSPGEEVWIRRSRTGEKEFEAVIENVTEVHWTDQADLIDHLAEHGLSGFPSHIEWFNELNEMHDLIPNPLYIHRVRRKSPSQESSMKGDRSE